jgi:hypothetical protein
MISLPKGARGLPQFGLNPRNFHKLLFNLGIDVTSQPTKMVPVAGSGRACALEAVVLLPSFHFQVGEYRHCFQGV